ncbi:MAG: NAD-dependent epimerase [Synechococcales bacterium]|nr:NAD-dependent epimerase [Synechococcales bacterium]
MSRILVTGAAGFIGYHVCHALLNDGHTVIGMDNLNAYYSVRLKHDRLARILPYSQFQFHKIELGDRTDMEWLFAEYQPEFVVHLAAQAGVRYSLTNPHAYADSNLTGFLHVLEGCRASSVKHLIFASSSSVYGANRAMPFAVGHNVDHPLSLYAATKKANELMAHTYSHLYGIPCTGLRFFTVYGPWGRPDMATYKFTQAILEGQPIDVYNYGKMRRDFTYIDDIVEAIFRLLPQVPQPNPDWSGHHPDPSSSQAPYRVYNIGNHQPVTLLKFIETLENCLGVKAAKNLLPLQPGDVLETFADVEALHQAIAFRPQTTLQEGLQQFVDWYRQYTQLTAMTAAPPEKSALRFASAPGPSSQYPPGW